MNLTKAVTANEWLNLEGFPPMVIRATKGNRHLRIRMDVRNRHFVISCPLRLSRRKVIKFLQANIPWVKSQWDQLPPILSLDKLENIVLFGRRFNFQYTESKRKHLWCENDKLILNAPIETAEKSLEKWLRKYTLDVFALECEKFAKKADATYKEIRIRDTKSQWGSCSHDGNLTFSWRLILAPKEVAQYVIAHEVAHLKHHNHGPDFWALVDTLVEDREHKIKWLKEKGATLFAMLPS